jgi:hypothetical protein
MGLSVDDAVRLMETIFPGLVILILVGGVAFRLTAKPTIDAILRLPEGLRSDEHQTRQTIARLEEEIRQLRSGELHIPPVLGEGGWAKEPRGRD